MIKIKDTIAKIIFNYKISASSLAILLISIICFCLTLKYTWNDCNNDGYSSILSSDGLGYYIYLPNTFINNTINEQVPDNRFFFEGANKNGVNKYYAGTAVAMFPFFYAGYLTAIMQETTPDGYTSPFHRAIIFTALFYLIVGLIFLKIFLSLYEIRDRIIALSLVIIVFGSNLLMYTIIYPAWSHIYSFCFITSFLYFAKKYFITYRTKYLYVTAFVFGFIIIIRPVNGLIIFLIPFLAGSLLNLKKVLQHTISIKHILISCFILFAVLSIQLYAWYLQSGEFFVRNYKYEGFNFTNPQIWNILFSFRKGLFIYTPLIFLSLFGLFKVGGKNKYELLSFSLFFLLLVYVISSWWNWYYGPSFGHRSFIEFYGIFVLLLAILLNDLRIKWLKYLVFTIIGFFIVLNLIQSYQYNSHIMSVWDMNYEKYKYTFLKTSTNYQDCLGGNNAIWPYKPNSKSIYKVNYDIEKTIEGCRTDQIKFDSICNSNVSDFTGRDFNTIIEIKADSTFVNDRGLFVEASLDRLEIDSAGCTQSLFVVDVSNPDNGRYIYYPFPVNETPSHKTGTWKTYKYSIEVQRVRAVNDIIKIYIWNKDEMSFYIDNFNVEIYSIN